MADLKQLHKTVNRKEDQIEEKEPSDRASFTFGRFNPITTGHKKLIDTVKEHARKTGGDHHIFVSHTQDAKKNPLSHKQKVGFINKMMPGTNVHEEDHIKNAIQALEHLHKKGYKKATMLVGSDRVQEFSNLLNKYNPGIDIEVKSAGDRDPDAEGVEGMSASKMRDFAAKKNFAEFSKGVPKKEYAKELYHATRKGMKLENFQACFLAGGPGSGKDFILRTALSESGAIEIPLEKLHKAITEQKEIEGIDFGSGQSVIVNGNADDGEKVNLCKAVLEALNYTTAMVYVYTTNEDSRERNEARFRKGEKTITEALRAEKYSKSVDNMHSFSESFSDGFFLFNNSGNIAVLKEDHKEQVISWLRELTESINAFFESKPNMGMKLPVVPKQEPGVKGGHPVPSGHKRIKDGSFFKLVKTDDVRYKDSPAVTEELDVLFEKTYPTIVDMIAQKKGDKGQKAQGGIAVPGDKATEKEVVEDTTKVPEGEAPGINKKKDRPKKGAGPAPDFFDARMGAVPSGGVGLSANIGEGKSFNSLRKR